MPFRRVNRWPQTNGPLHFPTLVRIAPFTSFFLDGLRFLAALGVVFAHLDNSRLVPGAAAVQAYGGCFVVAFFVLSGCVIAATTDPSRSDGVRYFAVRLARLWTVALPALAVAYVLQMIGEQWEPGFFSGFDRGYSSLRYFLTAIFANEFWFASTGPPMDLPVWSLAYEFWYYTLFGIAVYVRKPLARALALLLVCGIVGPKLLLLFPIWLLGVAVWQIIRFRHVLERWAFVIIGASAALMAALLIVHPRWPGNIGSAPWFFSGAWISDWLFGLGIAGLIVGTDARFHSRAVPRLLNAAIKQGAGVSFSLYLLHYPLMVFCAAFLPYDPSSRGQVAGVLALVFLVVYAFGSVFEPQRKPWALRLEATVRILLRRFGPVTEGAAGSYVTATAAAAGRDLPDAGIGR